MVEDGPKALQVGVAEAATDLPEQSGDIAETLALAPFSAKWLTLPTMGAKDTPWLLRQGAG